MKEQAYLIPSNENRIQRTAPDYYVATVDNKRVLYGVVSDIDGTLNDEHLPEKERIGSIAPAKEAVSMFETNGVPFGLLSARSTGEAVLYQQHLEASGVILAEDGAVGLTARPAEDLEMVKEELTSSGYSAFVYRDKVGILLSKIAIDNIKNLIVKVQDADPTNGNFVSSLTTPVAELQEKVGHESLEDAKLSTERFASAYARNLSARQLEMLDQMAPERGIRTFTNPKDRITMFFPTDANKGHALEFLCDNPHLFYPTKDKVDGVRPIVFGNRPNDIPLFHTAERYKGIAVLVADTEETSGYAVSQQDIAETVIKSSEPNGHGVQKETPLILAKIGISVG